MNDCENNEKSSVDSPNKSQGNYRSGYHHRGAPYTSKRPAPPQRKDVRQQHPPSKPNGPNVKHESAHESKSDESSSVKGADGADVCNKAKEKKFTGRCRIFVGNIPGDMSDDEFRKLFEPFGEMTEVFLNASRGFGFVRMETRYIAEQARTALDGQLTKSGRNLRVRLAGHNAALRVKYLSQHVSNEMLEQTFSMFGEVERAIVIVDDKGKPTGEGIVEFARKPAAMSALKRISEGVFLMSSQPRPIAVELLEQNDEADGLPEMFFPKTNDLLKDREKPPRFAQPGTFEADMGQKWKKLYQLYRDQEELLKRNFADEVSKLEADQETALLEQHTLMLRQDLQRRQEELRMLEEQTQNEIKRRMEMRRQEEDRRRSQLSDGGEMRMRQDDVLRRQMEMAKNSPSDSFFSDRNSERSSLAPPLQPPPVPPGVDRARMGGMNLLGSLGNPQNAGNSGNLRMGVLPRPPHAGASHAPHLLMDPSASMRPSQAVRFDASSSLGQMGGNLFGMRPPTNVGPGLMQGRSDNRGSGDHVEAKRVRRM